MIETKTIPTLTNLSSIGSDISIETYYFDITTLPYTIEARIADNTGVQDGVSFYNGDLLMREINSPNHISYLINNRGELIVSCDTGDSSNYFINENGELVYTKTE